MVELSIDAFNEFECIGGKCEDHCCKEWIITIDEKTYNNYENEKNEEFKKMFNTSIKKLGNSTKSSYAYMVLNKDRDCGFLDNKKLCSIYKMLGPENMCITCKVYPRRTTHVDGILEKTLELSCPEACRKILLRENPIEFKFRDIADDELIRADKNLDFNKEGMFSKEIYMKLRALALNLLQYRNYTIEERIITLGFFIEDIMNKDDEEINNVINLYIQDIIDNKHKGVVDYLNVENYIDTEVAYSIKSYLSIVSKIKLSKGKENVLNIKDGLKLEKDIDFEDFKKNYIDVKSNYYKPFIEQYEYIYENYLINYIFKNNTMSCKESLFKDYAEMLIYYSMVKFSIIGNCGKYKEDMNETNLILSISTFLKGIEHNENTANKIKNLVEEFKFNNLSNLIPLILM